MLEFFKSKSTLPSGILTSAWAIALGAIAPMLDSTMINMAIKQLNEDFHTTLSVVQWAITGYVLAIAIAVPIAGWLMNHFNSKHIFIGAVISFGITSFLAGISWNINIFIFFRLLQGFSAGIITPLMFTLLVKIAGQDKLGRVMAIVSTPMIFGPILGPVLGGIIIHFASWPWMFFINVFSVLIAVPFMLKTIPNFKPFDKTKKLDIWGILLLAGMSTTLIYGITKAADSTSFANQSTLIWLTIGIILAICYFIYNRIKKNQTVFPLELFAYPTFLASGIGLFLANIAIMGPMFIFPLFFQTIWHFSPIEAALALVPQGIGMLITRPLIGKMVDKSGAKLVVIVSLVVALAGSIPFIFFSASTNIWWIMLVLFIRGTSVGGITLALTSDAYTELNSKELPEAGIGINMIENIGASFGTALIATIIAAFVKAPNASITKEMISYHYGFLVPVIGLILLFIPSLFLTNKNC